MDVVLFFMVAFTALLTMAVADTVDDIQQEQCPIEAEDS